jgi:hypothetical protein
MRKILNFISIFAQGLYISLSTTLAIFLGFVVIVAIVFPVLLFVYWIITLVSPTIEMVEWWYWLLLGLLPDLWIVGKYGQTVNS